jgi:hypothetical protein
VTARCAAARTAATGDNGAGASLPLVWAGALCSVDRARRADGLGELRRGTEGLEQESHETDGRALYAPRRLRSQAADLMDFTWQTLKITVVTTLALMTLGCQPVVKVSYFEYSVTVHIEGDTQTLRGRYACYWDATVLNPVGPNWTVQRETAVGGDGDVISLRGTTADGSEFQVQPTQQSDQQLYLNTICDLPAGGFDSRVFYKHAQDAVYNSYDPREASKAPPGQVSVVQSRRELLREGSAFHGSHAGHVTALKTYYTLSVHLMNHDTIDRLGLRQYVSTSQSAWLGDSAVLPLRLPSRDTTTSSSRDFKYADQLRQFLEGDSPESTLAMESSGDGEWRVGSSRQWAPFAGQSADLSAGIALDFPTNIPAPKTCWAQYKGHRIEVPILLAASRHFYDAASDALVIFVPVFVQLSAD